jgi:hypothetical protein
MERTLAMNGKKAILNYNPRKKIARRLLRRPRTETGNNAQTME